MLVVVTLFALISCACATGYQKNIPPKHKKLVEHTNLKRKHDLTIVAIPSCGLGNRLRNVNGAALMATSMNAQMEILWVENMAHCSAKFSDLFAPIDSPNVKVVEIRESNASESERSKYGRYNSLREIPNSVYCEGYCVKYKGSMALCRKYAPSPPCRFPGSCEKSWKFWKF